MISLLWLIDAVVDAPLAAVEVGDMEFACGLIGADWCVACGGGGSSNALLLLLLLLLVVDDDTKPGDALCLKD